jgi:threonine dehydrogenase-like Zn-dependent dehydrogenase
MIKDGEIDFTRIITHKLPLSDFNKGLELISNKEKSGAIKVVYNP